MNVLGIYGSPRKGGNSDIILDKVLDGAAEAGAACDRIYCRKLKMSGCLSCGGCDETGECVVKDDMTDIYPLLDWADRIVLATPIFFYAPTAQAKLLIDRCQARWSRRMLTKTREERKTYDRGIGYLVATGATHGKNLFDPSELIAKYFYDALDMGYEGGVLLRGLEGRGAVNEHPDMLAEAFEFGKSLAG